MGSPTRYPRRGHVLSRVAKYVAGLCVNSFRFSGLTRRQPQCARHLSYFCFHPPDHGSRHPVSPVRPPNGGMGARLDLGVWCCDVRFASLGDTCHGRKLVFRTGYSRPIDGTACARAVAQAELPFAGRLALRPIGTCSPIFSIRTALGAD